MMKLKRNPSQTELKSSCTVGEDDIQDVWEVHKRAHEFPQIR